MTTSTDRIEKTVKLDAPRSRVWRAISDSKQFGQWFGVTLSSAFAPGAAVEGRMNHPKYAHLALTIWIESVDPERFFSFRWHPYALEEGVDYNAEPTTLVTFSLEPEETGTRLTIVESGFDAIPESRRAMAFSMNDRGWASQVENIRKFLLALDNSQRGGQ